MRPWDPTSIVRLSSIERTNILRRLQDFWIPRRIVTASWIWDALHTNYYMFNAFWQDINVSRAFAYSPLPASTAYIPLGLLTVIFDTFRVVLLQFLF
jgi:hypothetical protein